MAALEIALNASARRLHGWLKDRPRCCSEGHLAPKPAAFIIEGKAYCKHHAGHVLLDMIKAAGGNN